MSARRLAGNMGAAMANVLVTGAVLFELYRFLARTIGPESIGIWSLVMATTAAARLGDFGLGNSVIKFVAADLGGERRALAAGTVGLAACSIGVMMSLICAALWPISRFLLGAALPAGDARVVGFALLPWALGSLWLLVVANVFLSSLDAAQRTAWRTAITVSAAIAHLVAVYAVVPTYGLAALGPLQLALSSVTLVGAVVAAGVVLAEPPRSWVGWPRARVRELFRYGSTFQLAALGQLAFEPTVKWLLGVFGTLTLNGYFEMANRAVTQLRQIIAAAYQMLVPYISSRLSEPGKTGIDPGALYDRAARLLLLIAVPYFVVVACVLPYILTLWLGVFDPSMIAIGLVCLAGWCINALSIPSFILYLAIGRLRWTVATQMVIGVLNLLLAGALGRWLGGGGVVVGAMLALGIGSMVVVTAFHREHGMSARKLWDRTLSRLLIGGAIAVAVAVRASLAWAGEGFPPLSAVLTTLLYALYASYSIYHHPLSVELIGRLMRREANADGIA